MTETKSKIFYWIFRVLGIVVSCALPVWAVLERFPVWADKHGTGRSLGAGGILIIVVLLVVFRKTVFSYIKERFHLTHTPPIFAWVVLLLVSYLFLFMSKILYDMTTVFWMGLLGCGIGTFLSFIAESRFNAKKEEDKQNE